RDLRHQLPAERAQPDDDRPAHAGNPRPHHVRVGDSTGRTGGGAAMNVLLSAIAGLLLAAGAGAQAQTQAQAPSGGMDKAFEAWDTDHNGVISRTEFEKGWQGVIERGVAARLRAQFDKLDRNDDGGLDGAEYASLALVMQAGKDAPALAAFAANGDKRLQFDEYVASVRTRAAAARRRGGTRPWAWNPSPCGGR